MTKPIFTLPAVDRFVTARRRRGELVVVEVDSLRNGNVQTFEGEIVSVAFCTPSDVVVLRPERGEDRAFSLAQIRGIRPWHPERTEP